jgi:AraC-like DNA-binding protein
MTMNAPAVSVAKHEYDYRGEVLRHKGLFRTLMAGRGRTLVDAFENLEKFASAEGLAKHPRRNLLGARLNLAPDEGEGHWRFAQIDRDVYVVIADLAYKDLREEVVPGEGMIQFFFTLAGDMSLGFTQPEPLRINRPSLLVFHQPKGVDFKEWIPPNASERWVAITLSPQFLIDHVCGSFAEVSPQLQSFISENPDKLAYCQLSLSAPMLELATKLVNNPYAGSLGLLYTEAVALELLCVAVASFASFHNRPSDQYSERELRCLHAARDLLLKQMAPVPTTRLVARRVGLNETTLKRGFRVIFGETVFEFSLRCRMQHALALIRDQRQPVARVAEAVGYSHQTSFATAFRRHFAVRPRDVRRSAVEGVEAL